MVRVRLLNALARAGISTVGEVCKLTTRDILRLDNVGATCLKYVSEVLAQNGLHLLDQEPIPGLARSSRDGGPAFPVAYQHERGGTLHAQEWGGMTLRDYYAGQALVGLLAGDPGRLNLIYAEEDIARKSNALADAMLRARKAVQP